jgi:hypothetical protein
MPTRVHFDSSFGTRFILSVDTEEEFEWGGGFAREGHGLASVPALADGQRFFESAGVAPCYFVDAPIASSGAAVAILRPALEAGRAEIGVHLHPWVTAPFDEALTSRNSYAGNLPLETERAKLRTMTALFADRFGEQPRAYRAGRYGIGPNTLGLLDELGYLIDSSLRSQFDYRADGGPDFRASSLRAHWTGPRLAMLELPLTSVFVGAAGRWGPQLYHRLELLPTTRALLARTGLMQRVPLTPEGVPAALACDAIDVAIDIGLPVLTMSFHSPSLAIGHTPYVRDAADLAALYAWFDRVFDHCARRSVLAATPNSVHEAAVRSGAACHAATPSAIAASTGGACSSAVRAGRS